MRFTGIRYAELLYRNTRYVYDNVMGCHQLQDMMELVLHELFDANMGRPTLVLRLCNFLADMQFDISRMYIRRCFKSKKKVDYELVDMGDVTKGMYITVNHQQDISVQFGLPLRDYVVA